MGFVPSSSTVAVTATLTVAGKKKLFEALGSNTPSFISKFGLGDSDANYDSIAGGFGTLSTGNVPEISEFKPKFRGSVIAKGDYIPGVGRVLVDGVFGIEFASSMAVGANKITELIWEIGTEWPRNTEYNEAYSIEVSLPENISDTDKLLKFLKIELDKTNKLSVKFLGNASPQTLTTLFGSKTGGNNSTTISIRIAGKDSGAISVINLDLTE